MPDEAYTIPFGEANLTREGEDVTIVAFGRMVHFANQVADQLMREKIACTVIDPRTTSPLDTDTILESVQETGRLVIVDEAQPALQHGDRYFRVRRAGGVRALKAPI